MSADRPPVADYDRSAYAESADPRIAYLTDVIDALGGEAAINDPIVWGLHQSHVQDLARMALDRELDADELETFSVGLDNSTVFETVDLILSNLHDASWLR